MKLRYTNHSRDQMAAREVLNYEVEGALENVVSMWDDPVNGSVVILGRVPDGRILKIAVVGRLPLGASLTIKTVAWRDNV